jgi:glycosyltransferase involved in cell wall biosynthesis
MRVDAVTTGPGAGAVSLVILCRDQGEWLEAAIDSAYAQDLPLRELLVVDDGSCQPETLRVLAGCRWPRLRVVRQAHPASAAARNLGWRETTGEFVCLIDSADRLGPGFLSQAIAALGQEPDRPYATAWLRTGPPILLTLRPGSGAAEEVFASGLPEAAVWRRRAVPATPFDEGLPDGEEVADLRLRLLASGTQPGLVLAEPLLEWDWCGGEGGGPAGAAVSAPLLARHGAEWARLADVIARRRGERLLEIWRGRVTEGANGSVAWELAEARRRVTTLERALSRANERVVALGDSWSWRVTAPLRRLHSWVSRGAPRR